MSAPSSKPGDTTPEKQAATTPSQEPKKSRAVKQRVNPAEALLIAKEREKAQAEVKKIEDLNAGNLFYLRCPRNQHHHGIYLLEYPVDGNIHPGLWCSIEHAPGEPWVQPRIRCQECLIDGDPYVSLWLRPHQMPDGQTTFTLAHPRGVEKDKTDQPGAGHINRIPRAQVEARMGRTIEEMLAGIEPVTATEGGN